MRIHTMGWARLCLQGSNKNAEIQEFPSLGAHQTSRTTASCADATLLRWAASGTVKGARSLTILRRHQHHASCHPGGNRDAEAARACS